MSEGVNLTRRDYNQIPQYEHDELANAKRVVVVGQEINIDTSKVAESLEKAVLKGLSNFKLDKAQAPSYTPIEVERTVYIPQIEIKTIEVPVIVKQIEYREIEKPIIVEKIVTVEKPVYITEFKEIIKEKDVPKWQRICITIQTAAVIGVLLMQIISHLK